MLRAMSKGALKPAIGKVFKFDQVPEAFRFLKSASHFGKICIEL